MLLTIIVFILVLGLLVFIHELGHFLLAKRAKIRVEEFAFGFPPKIFAKKIGETKYAINLIPLGGYVKLWGEEGKHLKDPRAFYAKPLNLRFFVITAGVVMNLILAWFLFSVGYAIGLPITTIDPAKISGATVSSELIIADTMENSPAANAKLSKGDIILGAENSNFSKTDELTNFTKENAGQKIFLNIKRYGFVKKIPLTLSTAETGQLGVYIIEAEKVKVPFWQAPIVAAKEVINIIKIIFKFLGKFFVTLFTSGKAEEGVVGPVGIWFIFRIATKLGIAYILQLTAYLCLNLAMINILPFPALDGGKLIFWAIEAVRKKRVTPRIENIVHGIGFAILIGLVLAITFRDIIRGI